MIISIIAAVAQNNVIGGGNTLLWHLPEDMKHFRGLTSGHTVIMGRKTFESISKPLPNRQNIVITRDVNYFHAGVDVVNSLEEALKLSTLELGKDFEQNQDDVEVFIIGGGEIYKQAFLKANKLYITHIEKEFEGDTFFPEIDPTIWIETSKEEHLDNELPYKFSIYEKSSD